MKQRFFARSGLIVGGLFPLTFWLMTILALRQHLVVAYQNAWGLPIYTSELIVFSLVATPIWLWAVFRFWNWRGGTAA